MPFVPQFRNLAILSNLIINLRNQYPAISKPKQPAMTMREAILGFSHDDVA